MPFCTEMIISLLELSKGKHVLQNYANFNANLPLEIAKRLLKSLQRDGLVYVKDGLVEISSMQRLLLALRAFELGADCERVSSSLDWREFERAAAVAFETHGYTVVTNLRFKQGGRRWEMDIIGCREPLVVCVDCKHWRRGLSPSRLRGAVDEQAKRTLAFSRSLPNPAFKFESVLWEEARFVPAVLSLVPTSLKFHNRTPVVPISQLQDFVAQLPMRLDLVRYFRMTQRRFKTLS
jgi:Holliday junction resolvase-like predicted endonuclease